MEQISKGLKWFFLIHMVVLFLFGFVFFFAFEAYVALSGWPFSDPISGRYIGAFFIGLGITNILAYRETEWKRIELYVVSLILAFILEIIALIWGLFLSNSLPVYLNLFIEVALLAGFLYFYFKQRK